MQQIPGAGFVVIVMLIAAVILQKVDTVEKLHDLLTHVLIAVYVIEYIRTVSGCVHVIREHTHDIAYIYTLVFLFGQLLYDRIHPDIMYRGF